MAINPQKLSTPPSVGPLCLLYPLYFCSLVLINSLPSEMLYLEILFQPALRLPQQLILLYCGVFKRCRRKIYAKNGKKAGGKFTTVKIHIKWHNVKVSSNEVKMHRHSVNHKVTIKKIQPRSATNKP